MHTGDRKGLRQRGGKLNGKLGDTWRKVEAETASFLESKSQQGQDDGGPAEARPLGFKRSTPGENV